MESIIYRLFFHEFQSAESKEFQQIQRHDRLDRADQIILESLEGLAENRKQQILGEVRELIMKADGDHAEYFAEGFSMGAKLMIEVLTVG